MNDQKSQLDRIEQKLDRLLSLMGSNHSTGQIGDDIDAVLATGGIDALKSFIKNMPPRKGGGV